MNFSANKRNPIPSGFEWLLVMLESAKANGPVTEEQLRNILRSPILGSAAIRPGYHLLNEDLANGGDSSTFGTIVGIFSAPYNRSLSGEALFFRHVLPDHFVAENYPSMAQAIDVLASSSGFHGRRSVAIFPETFVWPRMSENSGPVFYFINKFVDRFFEVTKAAIASPHVSQNSFPHLMPASRTDILDTAVSWVHLHEYFHAQGAMPFAEYRTVKSSRSSAAIEELRVDVLTIIEAMNGRSTFGLEPSQRLAEFVLAERLLRYPLQAHPDSDYDARSSHVFLSRLLHHGAVSFTEGSLHVHWDRLFGSLNAIANEINQLENRTLPLDAKQAKAALGTYAKENSSREPHSGKYCKHTFYKKMERYVLIG